ncbi:SIMPL domain-containing protein [Helicobacter turcicus]|uniref:SIMPL domain-containing protein n=1 Tax=Helicobacter turcicus TaxID=2867412 RepID=A0ABS7JN11_9HELI|nr:SIMPL domain-containing protein [Helicobacter turcicus]MBX7490794.1 SIMPL domain-containing protein [Helicobacter turcicus]MBX7545597.1 SIMPL domain-containing protein [Helicobacter turcicus]
MDKISALLLSVALIVSSIVLGFSADKVMKGFKAGERSVIVKGLSEKEVQADVMILPIKFTRASNDLNVLYKDLENDAQRVFAFLEQIGLNKKDITFTPPIVNDKLGDLYGSGQNVTYRYAGVGSVLLYTKDVVLGRKALEEIAKLGMDGLVIKIDDYDVEYVYTELNVIKPQMIEEATLNAREAAMKFAKDSESQLGKIKKATQGQFSISNRDKNTPYIKNVRVVSTVEYYLED